MTPSAVLKRRRAEAAAKLEALRKQERSEVAAKLKAVRARERAAAAARLEAARAQEKAEAATRLEAVRERERSKAAVKLKALREQERAEAAARLEAAKAQFRAEITRRDERFYRVLTEFHACRFAAPTDPEWSARIEREQQTWIRDLPKFRALHRQAIQADAIFASFPKSGRTWVRYVMEHYISLKTGAEFTAKSRTATGFGKIGSVFFTEDYFDSFGDEFGDPFLVLESEMRTRALVVLVRDPRDTIVSYYHWTVRNRKVLANTVTIEQFVRSPIYGIERMSSFVLKLLALFSDHSGPKHLLRYETCWNDPAAQFTALLTFLEGDRFDPDCAREALKRASFEQMQKREIDLSLANSVENFERIGVRDWNGDVNALKVRKGGSGGYLEEAPWLDNHLREFPQTALLITAINELA